MLTPVIWIVATATVLLQFVLSQRQGSWLFTLPEAVLSAVALASYRIWCFRPTREQSDEMPEPRWGFFWSLVGITLLPWVIEPFLRGWVDLGAAVEERHAASLRNLMLGLYCLGTQSRYHVLAVICSWFVVIFAFVLFYTPLTCILVALYVIAVMQWLLGTYWQKLSFGTTDQRSRVSPIFPGLMVCAVILAIGAGTGWAVGNFAPRGPLLEWIASSGGTGDSDPFARSGINDGDLLVGGETQANSFGPVETKLFLESDSPSLYDVFNDRYDEPSKKIVKNDRSMPLPPQSSDMSERHLTTHEKSQREFNTVRPRMPRQQSSATQNTSATAIFHVYGRVPLHLRVEAYNAWDGRVWSWLGPPASQELSLFVKKVGDKPWIYQTTDWMSKYHAQENTVITLNYTSPRIPTAAQFRGVHVPQVDRLDLFRWLPDGQLSLQRETVPRLTAFRLRSALPSDSDLKILKFKWAAFGNIDRALTKTDSPPTDAKVVNKSRAIHELQQQNWRPDPLLDALATEIAGGLPRGYAQINAVRDYLRNNYQLDFQARVPEETPDAAKYFLLEARRGPDYLFATAATDLLRRLHYDARVVGGYYVHPEKYQVKDQFTEVTANDAHVWCEVSPDGYEWIALEPTPGYELAVPPRSWTGYLAELRSNIQALIWRHGGIFSVAGVILCWVLWCRKRMVTLAIYLLWRIRLSGRSTSAQTLLTIQYLETHARLWNYPRLPGETLQQWLARLPRWKRGATQALTRFRHQAEAKLYGNRGDIAADPPRFTVICLAVAKLLWCAPPVKFGHLLWPSCIYGQRPAPDLNSCKQLSYPGQPRV
ncbi:MAG: transglutaminase-like domain-containing protein [Pirellulales bacterium]|nr:transglutaminase-like domain-containing protein [Pirellulales bacterium]